MMRMKPSRATRISEPNRARYSRLHGRSATEGLKGEVLIEAVDVPKQSPNERNSCHIEAVVSTEDE